MRIPAHTTTPPRSSARSAAGTSGLTGAKMIAASNGSGGDSSEPPAHSAPSERANAWGSVSPGEVNADTRRPPQAPPLRARVRGGPEAVEPEPLRITGEAVGAKADQPAAQQRGGG